MFHKYFHKVDAKYGYHYSLLSTVGIIKIYDFPFHSYDNNLPTEFTSYCKYVLRIDNSDFRVIHPMFTLLLISL